MENLRWIMLAVGVGVIAIIYLIGKSKNKSVSRDLPEPVSIDDMPNISTDTMNDVDLSKDDDYEFVPSEINNFELNQKLVEEVSASVDDGLVDVITSGASVKPKNKFQQKEDYQKEEAVETEETAASYEDDLIVIHVEAKSAYFMGGDLLKVINQQQLKFGDMNIYHAYDESGEIMFSMSNMLQPGHFEPDHIVDMRTPGVILFMQLSLVNESVNAFERLYHCAEVLARELDAKLTSDNRHSITDQNIQAFRKKAEYYSQIALTE